MFKIPDWQKSHPKGLRGRILLRRMGKFHKSLDEWAISNLTIAKDAQILDLGCGNGDNIKRFLKLAESGFVYGADISKTSVSCSKRKNRKAIKNKQAQIYLSDVLNLSLANASLDLISGFCTVRLWSNLDEAILKIKDLLKPNGIFLICDYGRYNVEEMMALIKEKGFSRVENIKKEPNFNLILAYK